MGATVATTSGIDINSSELPTAVTVTYSNTVITYGSPTTVISYITLGSIETTTQIPASGETASMAKITDSATQAIPNPPISETIVIPETPAITGTSAMAQVSATTTSTSLITVTITNAHTTWVTLIRPESTSTEVPNPVSQIIADETSSSSISYVATVFTTETVVPQPSQPLLSEGKMSPIHLR